jgi:deoxycytidine triphosphate deaminase
MVLGADRILDLVKNGVEVEDHTTGKMISRPLVELLSDDQTEGIEGTTLDLRLGAIFKPVGTATLLRNTRITPVIEELMNIESEPDGVYTVKPADYLLFQTIERVNLPAGLFAYIRPRTTMIRSCIPLETAFISPNYQGRLTVGMKHQGHNDVEIQMGFRILCIAFMPIEGVAVPYRGVWQGDRVSTDGKVERPF